MEVPTVETCESSVNGFSSLGSNVFEPSVEYRGRAFKHGFTLHVVITEVVIWDLSSVSSHLDSSPLHVSPRGVEPHSSLQA